MTLADINGLEHAEFVRRLGGVIEHSPWIAGAAWHKRPFANVEALHAAMIGEGQKRGEVDPCLDPQAAAQTLFAAIEGVALRGAVLGKNSVENANAQFRALAER